MGKLRRKLKIIELVATQIRPKPHLCLKNELQMIREEIELQINFSINNFLKRGILSTYEYFINQYSVYIAVIFISLFKN